MPAQTARAACALATFVAALLVAAVPALALPRDNVFETAGLSAAAAELVVQEAAPPASPSRS